MNPSRPARARRRSKPARRQATAASSRIWRGRPPSEAATSSPSASRSSGRIQAERQHEADEHVGPHDAQRRPHPSEVESPPASQKIADLHAIAVGHHQRSRGRAEQRADRDSGQDHAPDRTGVHTGPADREHHRGRDQPQGQRRHGNSALIALGHTSKVSIAPKAAPPVTPITSGDASGFASAPCSSAPRRRARRRPPVPTHSRQPQLDDDLPQRALRRAGRSAPPRRPRAGCRRAERHRSRRAAASAAVAMTTTEGRADQRVDDMPRTSRIVAATCG